MPFPRRRPNIVRLAGRHGDGSGRWMDSGFEFAVLFAGRFVGFHKTRGELDMFVDGDTVI
jgi:hypothetical protein